MGTFASLVRGGAAVLAALVIWASSPATWAQEQATANATAATRVPAKNLGDKQCLMYGNVKPVFTADGEATVLRLEFGTGDGLFGGAWFPIKPAAAGAEPCRGFGLTVRGSGPVPGRAFVVIRDSKGGSYRSKDIAALFGGSEWQDVVLTAGDFAIDSETKADIAKTLPKQPDWTTMSRVDISAVNLDASPVLELKSIHYVMGGPAMAGFKPAEKSAVGPTEGRVTIKNPADKQCFSFGNVKPEFTTDGATPILRLAYGSGDGLFGGAWFPTAPPKIETDKCRGIVVSARGNGNRPGRAYLFLRNSKGGMYRSKDIAEWFAGKEWSEQLLSAADFIPDPDSKSEATKSLPKTPDFTTIERMDLSAVNLEAEPVLDIRSMYYDMGTGQPAPATARPKAEPDDTEPLAGLFLQTNADSDALTPMPKKVNFPQGTWWQRHKGFVARAKQGDVDLLWLGDSITDNWNKFKGTYGKLYPDVKSANFGIGGDGTQNLLWRLQNGELDGISPKVAVVLIGTNNVQWHKSEQVAEAIKQIVDTVRAKSPKTKVLLLGLFPRGDFAADNPGKARIGEVNAAIAKLDDGTNVRYLDISEKLANPDGSIRQELYADKVHLSAEGFTVWANAMQPLLGEMMK